MNKIRLCAARRIVVVAAGTLVASLGHAASFDCSKASAPVEKAICSDAALSALDGQMADVYRSAYQALSDEGKGLLKTGQKEWLGFIHTMCLENQTLIGSDPPEQINCLRRQYSDRVEQLEKTVVRMGPFLFSRVDHFKVTRASYTDDSLTSSGSLPGFSVEHVRYPRIDQPVNTSTVALNKLIVAWLVDYPDCDEGGDINEEDYLISATNDRIAISKSQEASCHGSPHGSSIETTAIFLLSPAPHLMMPSEMFKPGASWEPIMVNICLDELRRIYQADGGSPDDITTKAVASVVEEPGLLKPTAEGIIVTFPVYSLAAYAFGEHSVTVPWDAVRDILSPGFLIPK
jgi:uncharacterized protein